MLTLEQLAERRQYVGASEAAAVLADELGMDVHTFDSALAIYRRKVYGPELDDGDSIAIDAGNALEPVILRRYARERGVVVLPSPGSKRHPLYPHVGATPDGLVEGTRRGVEAKAPQTEYGRAAWWDDNGEPYAPDAYWIQCQIQCEVWDLDAVDLVGLIDGKLEVREVVRDREVGTLYATTIEAWWARHVAALVPPMPRDTQELLAEVRRAHPQSKGFVRAPSEDDWTVARELARIRAELKTLEERELALVAELQKRIGDADGISGVATWKTDATGRVNWQKVAAELAPSPELIAKHTSEPGRRFLLKVKDTTKNEERAA